MRKLIKLIILFTCMNIYGQKINSINEIFNHLNKNSFKIDLKSKNEDIGINDSIKLLKLYQIDSLSVYYKIDLNTLNNLASDEAISGGSEIVIYSNYYKNGILFMINSSSSISKSKKNSIDINFEIDEQYIIPYKILLKSNFEVDKIMTISWMCKNLPIGLLSSTEYTVQDYNTGLINSFSKEENYLNQEIDEIIDIVNKTKPVKLIYDLPYWLKKK